MNYIHNNNSIDEITYIKYNTNISSNTDVIALSNITYQNRQKYLLGWTQKNWSHLPSAFSFIDNGTPWWCLWNWCTSNNLTWTGRWEYQITCELYQNDNTITNNDFYNAWASSSDDVDGERYGFRQSEILVVLILDVMFVP